MIEFVSGNFFDYNADIRINTVNCVGVMGAGVALAFKQKYPKMYEEYVRLCEAKQIRPGKPQVWKENDIFNDSPITIINFPTKDHWKKPSEYQYIEDGLVWLKSYLVDKLSGTITVPALGCGHGGLDWDIVKPMIVKYLGDLSLKVLVFEPQSSLNSVSLVEINEELSKNGITCFAPNDQFYPNKLKGKSAANVYVKGNLEAFNQKIITLIIDSKAEQREKDALLMCIQILAKKNIAFMLGFSNSSEIDLVKEILMKNAKLILAIPYGILELKIRKDLREFWKDELVTIISTSQPKQTWKPSESINALKLRIKISDAILIANYQLESLQKFIKEFDKTRQNIFYINYWTTPVEFFERLNAKQIGKSKQTNLPNLESLLECLSS